MAACGIYFPDQGSNLGPLHWECRVLATGPPGQSHTCLVWVVCYMLYVWCVLHVCIWCVLYVASEQFT